MAKNGASSSNPIATWNAHNISIFCDICIKEVEAGHRPGTHFDKDGYANIRANFKAETGHDYERKQLKNKWDALKNEWKLWKDLVGKETGLGWNSSKGTVDASQEWWNNKIQINKEYGKFRKKGISPEMEDKLDRMFSNTVATGEHAWAPSSGVLPPDTRDESIGQVDSDDSDEIETMQDIRQASYRCIFNMNTSDDDVQDLEDGVIICAVARAVETYYLKYVHKTPCMNSSQTDIVCKMAIDIIKPMDSEFRGIPQEIRRDTRYIPYFKDCIGAIDGVHVEASIPPPDQVPYIGKYYLVDAGYPQMRGYLGPYKGERYHLPDFRRGPEPTGHKEVFNHMHSSLRSIIERTFGVWKKRWAILRDMPNYPFNKQVKIVIATMTLHNYIRRYSESDRHFDDPRDYCEESDSSDDDDEEYQNYQVEGSHEIEALRNRIAASLMNASN
nr:uncharacterized protein LOC103431050 [Malus domestica]